MNVKEYRRQIESQLNAAAVPEAAGADLASAAAPQQRWAEAIRQLADPHLDPEARKAALQVLQAGTFLGSQFAPLRADYVAALRTAATGAAADLRRSALDVLVNLKDEFARQKLVEGLRGIGEALVPPAAALGLLARDDHSSASAIARDLLNRAADIYTRAQAVRVLGSDPSAKSLLAEIMKNKEEFREVRRASAVALRSLDRQAFERTALDILRDHSDFEDIKSTVRGALEHAGVEVPSVSTWRQIIESIKGLLKPRSNDRNE